MEQKLYLDSPETIEQHLGKPKADVQPNRKPSLGLEIQVTQLLSSVLKGEFL